MYVEMNNVIKYSTNKTFQNMKGITSVMYRQKIMLKKKNKIINVN